MACWFWQNADKIGSFAQLFLVIIALAGLCYARQQINSGREATAKAVYADFLKLAFDHQYYDDGPKGEGDRKYERFVGIMLNACDELASTTYQGQRTKREMWKKVISAELRPHARYLASEQFHDLGGWNLYSRALKSVGLKLVIVT